MKTIVGIRSRSVRLVGGQPLVRTEQTSTRFYIPPTDGKENLITARGLFTQLHSIGTRQQEISDSKLNILSKPTERCPVDYIPIDTTGSLRKVFGWPTGVGDIILTPAQITHCVRGNKEFLEKAGVPSLFLFGEAGELYLVDVRRDESGAGLMAGVRKYHSGRRYRDEKYAVIVPAARGRAL